SAHFVRRDRFAVAGTAEHDSPIALAFDHRLRRRPDEKWIIHRLFAERSEVLHLVPKLDQKRLYFLFVMETGVVRAERDFHVGVLIACSRVCRAKAFNLRRALPPAGSRFRVRAHSTSSESVSAVPRTNRRAFRSPSASHGRANENAVRPEFPAGFLSARDLRAWARGVRRRAQPATAAVSPRELSHWPPR